MLEAPADRMRMSYLGMRVLAIVLFMYSSYKIVIPGSRIKTLCETVQNAEKE